MSNPLFSVGTSRGGTTFFARMLSINVEVKMASDPFLPLFRSFRTAVLQNKIDPGFSVAQPLNDYYFSDDKIAMMKAIQCSDLRFSLPSGELERLVPELSARMSLAAQEVTPFLKELQGATYEQLFASGLHILEKAYGAESAAWVGFNDNWVIEFLPILARAFPNSKCIIVIRDPRAAMASSLKLRERDPSKAGKVPLMYSFARHWRKHAAFAHMLTQDPALHGRIYLLRYEDLASDPARIIKELCVFLGVDYDEAMLDTDKFRPLKGTEWKVHSNFKVPEKGVYTESIEAWKEYLPKGTVEFIEFVCDPEMRLFGYETKEYQGGLPTEAVMSFLKEDDARAVGWRNNYDTWETEYERELLRKKILTPSHTDISLSDKEKNFLFKQVYDALLPYAR
ncbi:MAG: hypothetical protein UX17_C0002G0005 [Parcubacteria group bacterium GW2011_GWC2_45_7]|nr:MAG: hypothetical protein UX17_C0002G0005 [Parcubacteria group bacterium GW2011_GWC2_45_7]KKU74146.1 MAG: hypothetical protein UX98_C0001G0076 [Parcubacteria group bacterium GW2011_GWA2_47_26]